MSRNTLHLPVRDLLGRDRPLHPYRRKAYSLMSEAFKAVDAETQACLVSLAKTFAKRARQVAYADAFKGEQLAHIEAIRGARRLEMHA